MTPFYRSRADNIVSPTYKKVRGTEVSDSSSEQRPRRSKVVFTVSTVTPSDYSLRSRLMGQTFRWDSR